MPPPPTGGDEKEAIMRRGGVKRWRGTVEGGSQRLVGVGPPCVLLEVQRGGSDRPAGRQWLLFLSFSRLKSSTISTQRFSLALLLSVFLKKKKERKKTHL